MSLSRSLSPSLSHARHRHRPPRCRDARVADGVRGDRHRRGRDRQGGAARSKVHLFSPRTHPLPLHTPSLEHTPHSSRFFFFGEMAVGGGTSKRSPPRACWCSRRAAHSSPATSRQPSTCSASWAGRSSFSRARRARPGYTPVTTTATRRTTRCRRSASSRRSRARSCRSSRCVVLGTVIPLTHTHTHLAEPPLSLPTRSHHFAARLSPLPLSPSLSHEPHTPHAPRASPLPPVVRRLTPSPSLTLHLSSISRLTAATSPLCAASCSLPISGRWNCPRLPVLPAAGGGRGGITSWDGDGAPFKV